MAHVVGSIGGPFSQLVMSGGGLRCLWQGGFLDIARDPLSLSPQRVIGVSGGALSAAGFLAHCRGDVLDRFLDLARSTDHNLGFDQVNQDGRTLHQSANRRVVGDCLTRDRQETIAGAPHFQILIACPPSGRRPPSFR